MEVYNTSGQATTLEELKQIVGEQARDTYLLHVRARKRFRELGHRNYLGTAAVFMELYIGSFRTSNPDGWFYKTHSWWREEHGLSREVVDTAREKLKGLGIIEERHWIRNRVDYRLMPAATLEVLYPEGPGESSLRENRNLNHGSSLRESRDSECGLAAVQFAGKPPSHRREEEERKKSVGGSPAVSPPHHTHPLQEQKRRDPMEAVAGPSEGDGLGEQCVTVLERLLEQDGLAQMSPQERSRFRDEFAALVTELGLEAPQLRGGPLRRQLERWPNIHLTPRVAYDDAAKRGYPDMDGAAWRIWREHGWKPEDGESPYDPTSRRI